MSTLTSRNPYTGEINGTIETVDNDQLTSILDTAHQAYLSWRETSREKRKQLFLKLADIMEADADENAKLPTIEMGRLYSLSQKYISATANLVRRYANNAEEILSDQPFDHDGLKGHLQYNPLGVIFGIAPWNFPYNQLLRAAVPNILAGNTVVYKHASNVPLSLQRIQEFFDNA
jgi:succinate-semialdehyde dehydrogenase/glutarate-semialdehyde dehydrogenase